MTKTEELLKEMRELVLTQIKIAMQLDECVSDFEANILDPEETEEKKLIRVRAMRRYYEDVRNFYGVEMGSKEKNLWDKLETEQREYFDKEES